MRKKYFVGLFFLLLWPGNCLFATDANINLQYPVLIFDEAKKDTQNAFPPNYRASTPYAEKQLTKRKLAVDGFLTLNASGSAEFTVKQLSNMLSILKKPVYIIDLRQESHGFINDGYPISWYDKRDWGNLGLSAEVLMQKEQQLLQALLKTKTATIITFAKMDHHYANYYDATVLPGKSETVTILSVATEQQIVEKQGAKYLRLAITDHEPPTTKDVQTFLDFLKTLPANAWLHFHCHGGIGRTTTFLSLYDIVKNADKLSLQQILDRQQSWGDVYPFRFQNKVKPAWYIQQAEKRNVLLSRFYQYIHDGSYQKGVKWIDY